MSPRRRAMLGWPLLLAAGCERRLAAAAVTATGATAAPGDGGRLSVEELAFQFDPRFFAPKRPPGLQDWLAIHAEREQSFFSYVRGAPVRPTARRSTLVLQPLGPLSARDGRVLTTIMEFARLFFACPVRIAPGLPLSPIGMRAAGQGNPVQFLTGALVNRVLAPRLPEDALAYLGVTMADLYPGPGWNYVFGQGSFARRMGVYSLVRYTPEFWGERKTPTSLLTLVARSCKVLAHETGHMLSMQHCTRYECLMNGANSLGELDRSPIWLCPICLRKLHFNLGFDLLDRYRKLAGFFRIVGFPEWASWADARLAVLERST